MRFKLEKVKVDGFDATILLIFYIIDVCVELRITLLSSLIVVDCIWVLNIFLCWW